MTVAQSAAAKFTDVTNKRRFMENMRKYRLTALNIRTVPLLLLGSAGLLLIILWGAMAYSLHVTASHNATLRSELGRSALIGDYRESLSKLNEPGNDAIADRDASRQGGLLVEYDKNHAALTSQLALALRNDPAQARLFDDIQNHVNETIRGAKQTVEAAGAKAEAAKAGRSQEENLKMREAGAHAARMNQAYVRADTALRRLEERQHQAITAIMHQSLEASSRLRWLALALLLFALATLSIIGQRRFKSITKPLALLAERWSPQNYVSWPSAASRRPKKSAR